MRKLKSILVVLFVCTLCANAQIITIEIEAEITGVDDYYNLLEGNVSVGSTITGTYTYNTSTPDTNPFSWAGEYYNYSPPCGISLTLGNFSFGTDSNNVKFLIGVIDNYQEYTEDHYLIRSYNNLSLSNGVDVDHIAWQLDDYTGNAISSTNLPETAPVLSDWTYNHLTITGGIGGIAPCYEKTFSIGATVTSAVLVPEPVTLLLLCAGGLLIRKRG